MKRSILFLLSFFILFCGLLASCKKLEDYNTDPNRMPFGSVASESLLEELLMSTGEFYINRSYNFPGVMMQYMVSAGSNISYDRYYVSASSVAGIWNSCYRWAADAEHLRAVSVEKKNKACEAIAIAVKCMLLQTITDSFGEVPCREAFQSGNGNTMPSFDEQKDIYLTLIRDLRYANGLLDNKSAISTPGRDLLYGGDMMKWKKFINALCLRCYIHLSHRLDEICLADELTEMLADSVKFPLPSCLDDAAVYRFNDVAPFTNPLGSQTFYSNSLAASEYMINLMVSTNDPRIGIYYKKKGNVWKGVKSGVEAQESDWNSAAMFNGGYLAQYSSPFSLMRYDEVLFLKAEAAMHGWAQGLPQDYYRQAVTASIQYWAWVAGKSISDETIDAFLSRVPYDGSQDCLSSQKFVALFGAGFEPWNEYRRTRYPKLPIGPGTLNDHILPTRFYYPLTERELSPDAYQTAVGRLSSVHGGADDMKTHLWWSPDSIAE